MIALEKLVETFVTVSISDMSTIKYWQNLGTIMDAAKDNITKQWKIDDTYFTSLVTIGENLFTRHPKNLNILHKDSIDIMSGIIILVTYVNIIETVFFFVEWLCMILGKYHMLLSIHIEVRLVHLIEFTLRLYLDWTQICSIFYTPEIKISRCTSWICLTKIYNLTTERNILMMIGVVFFQNKRLESFIMKNIMRNMLIKIMFLREII